MATFQQQAETLEDNEGNNTINATDNPHQQRLNNNDYDTTYQSMRQHKDHPLRMKLLWDELFRAEDIKTAIEGNSELELDIVSDFMCAQCALICKDDIENAIQRLQAMADFRRDYGIVESYQEGCRALRKMIELVPNFILSFDLDPAQGTYVLVKNMSGLDALVQGSNPESVKDFFAGMYYFSHACNPDFQSIQKGAIALVECKGITWEKIAILKVLHKLVVDLFCCYPSTGAVKHYNTGAVFNVMALSAKTILPNELGKRFEVGLRFENGMESFFFLPDAATARQRLIHNLEESLRLRFANERTFSIAKSNREAVIPCSDDEVEAMGDARGLF